MLGVCRGAGRRATQGEDELTASEKYVYMHGDDET